MTAVLLKSRQIHPHGNGIHFHGFAADGNCLCNTGKQNVAHFGTVFFIDFAEIVNAD